MRLILLSPGHGKDTPGKRSPDSSLLEWEFNRRLVDRIARRLDEEGVPYVVLDYEEKDTSLKNRAIKANRYGRNCLYISVHGNAAGNGKNWMQARGWAAYTSRGVTKSDAMCEIFCKTAEKMLPKIGAKVRKASSKKYGWEENFYVLKYTCMPAILTENLFFDNKEDCEIMKSDEGIRVLAEIHVQAILDILIKGL